MNLENKKGRGGSILQKGLRTAILSAAVIAGQGEALASQSAQTKTEQTSQNTESKNISVRLTLDFFRNSGYTFSKEFLDAIDQVDKVTRSTEEKRNAAKGRLDRMAQSLKDMIDPNKRGPAVPTIGAINFLYTLNDANSELKRADSRINRSLSDLMVQESNPEARKKLQEIYDKWIVTSERSYFGEFDPEDLTDLMIAADNNNAKERADLLKRLEEKKKEADSKLKPK